MLYVVGDSGSEADTGHCISARSVLCGGVLRLPKAAAMLATTS
jgi:hypothetical protein